MNTTIKNTNTENIIPKLQNPGVKYSLAAVIIFLIIMLLLIIFKVDLSFKNVPKSDDSIIANTFIILFLGLLILGVCFALLPSLKEMGKLFAQISSVTYVIIYTIGIILFLTMVPEDTLNTYAKYILPITGILGTILFYKGITTNYIEMANLGYACINMTMGKKVGTNRTMVKRTFQAKGLDYVSELALLNAKDIIKILEWNRLNGINFFRLSSALVPWGDGLDLTKLKD
jgi:hypothetical protein